MKKLERTNERALRYVYKDEETPYIKLLEWIGLNNTLESRRVQDMMITINKCFQNRVPIGIRNLIKVRNSKYDLRGCNILSLPKVNSTKHGLKSFRYFAAKQWNALPEEIRQMAGTKQLDSAVGNINFPH